MLHVVFSFQSLILRGRGRRRSSVEEEGKLELLCERVVGEQAFSWIGFKKWATKRLLYASGAKQASKTAMPSFSNNECANSRALTPTVDLLHVFICLTCFWLLNCRPGFSRSCFYFFSSQRPLVVAEFNVRACCFLSRSPSSTFPSPSSARAEEISARGNKYQSVSSPVGYITWALREISLAPAFAKHNQTVVHFGVERQRLQPCWDGELQYTKVLMKYTGGISGFSHQSESEGNRVG